MKLIEKIRSKNNIPIVLFLIILINYFPLFKGNFGKNLDYAVTVKEMTISFAVELVLLITFLFKRIKLLKKSRIINFAILAITTTVLFIIQIKNFYAGNYESFDFINIACIFLNIFMLYVMFIDLEIEEKYIYYFFGLMVTLGIITCIANIYLFKEDILTMIKTANFISVKSFFAHRNQFAFFLYASVISNIILILRTNNKKYKILLFIPLIILGLNLITSSSRTGIAATALFVILFFISTSSIKIKYKLLTIIVLAVVLISTFFMLGNIYPDVMEKTENFIEKILVRKDTIKSFTGRDIFWNIAKDTLCENPINLSFGIGRFLAVDLIEQYYGVTQYHSFYIETLMTGGIMELAFFIGIFVYVFVKIAKSQIDKKYKLLYGMMYISFFVYCGFESLCRFSIGCADTICTIFFITIPLIHANSTIEKNEEKEIIKV